MRLAPRARWLAQVPVLLACACGGGSETLLTVELVTDLAPGRTFTAVRTTVSSPVDGSRLDREDTPVRTTDDLLAGFRVAELTGLAPGDVRVEVSLTDAAGDIVTSRRIAMTIRDRHAIRVVIASGCVGTLCPGGNDDATATECLGGRCVPPECVEPTDPACGDAECALDGDCTVASCAEPVCRLGVCLGAEAPGACGADAVCDPISGCVSTGGCECMAGETGTDTAPCGNCGLGRSERTRTCTDGCSWDPWSDWGACVGGGECSPGQTEESTGGCCGGACITVEMCARTCGQDCVWGSVSCGCP